MARREIQYRPTASTGMTTTKVKASFPAMTKAMVTAKISISGQRMAVRMIIMYAICTLDTSVVSRVTSEEEEKRSIFAKEKERIFR